MQRQVKDLLPYISDKIQKAGIRHEIHIFDSGAIMVDIWINERFYVVQIDGDMIGLSLITKESTPFDIIPDQSFKDKKIFKKEFDKIFP